MLGDLRAQRNSLRVGELRMIELARRYGHETVQAAMAEKNRRGHLRRRRLQDKAATIIRATVPDGRAHPGNGFGRHRASVLKI